MKIELWDSFNNRKISSHTVLLSAVKKQRKHLAAVRRANGQNSYLTYAFRYDDGMPVDEGSITQARMILDGYK